MKLKFLLIVLFGIFIIIFISLFKFIASSDILRNNKLNVDSSEANQYYSLKKELLNDEKNININSVEEQFRNAILSIESNENNVLSENKIVNMENNNFS
jgi:hypothetical protein